MRKLMTAKTTAMAVLALLAACSQAGEAADAPEPPAPAKVGRDAAYEAAAGEPEGFVRALYGVYAATGQASPAPGRDPLLGRTLNAMVGADHNQALGKGRRPYLRKDFICDCTGGQVVLTSVQTAQADKNNAEAAVVFTVDGQEKRQTLKLVREGMSWKVADVLVPGQAPLTERLLKVIE
ncbi:DUF3828 domain-containing protein [Brevundimonas naejangsanensis]|uniref:DUF3828 domain-containing protein n=1 Tax=Brevundimonas naejangsanensis TaxID=588932 RepID=A0A494RJJ9_9CAUL|nr:DUF3828 domain-containing protein [Brevundimonas naejangsanensis]AYG94074.1 DUF3828 domain-containing protein [Brevundimonas naejangsanensis]